MRSPGGQPRTPCASIGLDPWSRQRPPRRRCQRPCATAQRPRVEWREWPAAPAAPAVPAAPAAPAVPTPRPRRRPMVAAPAIRPCPAAGRKRRRAVRDGSEARGQRGGRRRHTWGTGSGAHHWGAGVVEPRRRHDGEGSRALTSVDGGQMNGPSPPSLLPQRNARPLWSEARGGCNRRCLHTPGILQCTCRGKPDDWAGEVASVTDHLPHLPTTTGAGQCKAFECEERFVVTNTETQPQASHTSSRARHPSEWTAQGTS